MQGERGTYRTVAEVDADIAEAQAQLRALHAERRQAKPAAASIIADFDAGKSLSNLAEHYRIRLPALRSLLWRHGRTVHGRKLARAVAAAVASRDGHQAVVP